MARKLSEKTEGARARSRAQVMGVRDAIAGLHLRLCQAHAVASCAERVLLEATDSDGAPALSVALREIDIVIEGLGRLSDGLPVGV